MGLIKAAKNAIGSTLRDQYKEYMECPALSNDVLVVKGKRSIFAGGTNRGDDNVITDGSLIAVADGQCMIIVEDGKIIDFCVGDSQAQTTGGYIYKSGTAPSMLTGGFDGLKKSFSTMWGRMQSGGQVDHVQKVYYINMLEIMNNKFGVGNLPFRDTEFGFTVNIKCYGTYTYKITDPIVFYSEVCGNVTQEYRRNATIDAQLKSEIHSKLGRALSRVSNKRIPYDQLNNYTDEVTVAINTEIEETWVKARGISIGSIAIEPVQVDEESAKKIQEFQSSRYYANPLAAAGLNAQADAEAKKLAAQNAGGAHIGFMNYNTAQQVSANTQNLFAFGQQQQMQPQQPGFSPQPGFSQPAAYQQQQPMQPSPGMDSNAAPQGGPGVTETATPLEAPTAAPTVSPSPADSVASDTWTCQCGAENKGKFCMECGTPAPVPVKESNGWVCTCGTENTGKFCMECGSKKPLDSKCESCGYEGTQSFKFCPECGAENLM